VRREIATAHLSRLAMTVRPPGLAVRKRGYWDQHERLRYFAAFGIGFT
jgi:hypothetical protein